MRPSIALSITTGTRRMRSSDKSHLFVKEEEKDAVIGLIRSHWASHACSKSSSLRTCQTHHHSDFPFVFVPFSTFQSTSAKTTWSVGTFCIGWFSKCPDFAKSKGPIYFLCFCLFFFFTVTIGCLMGGSLFFVCREPLLSVSDWESGCGLVAFSWHAKEPSYGISAVTATVSLDALVRGALTCFRGQNFEVILCLK